jgi:uncharacterized repeat protein (TIGR03803 family)
MLKHPQECIEQQMKRTMSSAHEIGSAMSKLRQDLSGYTMALALVILATVIPTELAVAQDTGFSPLTDRDASAHQVEANTSAKFTVLHSFSGGADGRYPEVDLILDAKGKLYSVTPYGGNESCNPWGCGVAFKMNSTGKETVLHSFTGLHISTGTADLSIATGGLTFDGKGNLYGTTYNGGDLNCDSPDGCGGVFKLDTTGKESILYAFTGTTGANPHVGLSFDADGNLYGVTPYGGDYNNCYIGCGVVFKLDTTGKETVLYSFTGGTDGWTPAAPVIVDAKGNLFGTTSGGGSYGDGVVFKLSSTGKETVLHSFTGGVDGNEPDASVIFDAKGNLYGTTRVGGAFGYGVVFKMSVTGKETVLYSFTGGTDGAWPYARVIFDANGNLYGTTAQGGSGNGVVFKLGKDGAETVLHTFTGGADGAAPFAGLIFDANGNLYGTAQLGGASNDGVVFKLTP